MKNEAIEYHQKRLININKHPSADLMILNYTADVQYGWLWDGFIEQFRGLIVDSDFNVIARPFPKFFNMEELKPGQIPNEPFEVFEKMDGSLGILYWADGIPCISTRGSFDSEQAIFATNLLHSKYEHVIPNLDQSKTYLFEIIYPENRIVVDYGGMQDLILLEIIDTQTGRQEGVRDIGFPVVQKYFAWENFNQLAAMNPENKEGFVVKFESGFRMKIKFQNYKELHRIVSGLSEKTIWEWLSSGISPEDKIEGLPDEYYNFVREKSAEITANYTTLERDAVNKYLEIIGGMSDSLDRKAFAILAQKFKLPGILFSMLDKKDYSQQIWKAVKPQTTN